MVFFLEILAVIAILFFMGITIASFVLLNKIFYQLRYKNYLMEKLNHNISSFNKNSYDEGNKKVDIQEEENKEGVS